MVGPKQKNHHTHTYGEFVVVLFWPKHLIAFGQCGGGEWCTLSLLSMPVNAVLCSAPIKLSEAAFNGLHKK